jgi:hypothetical protein
MIESIHGLGLPRINGFAVFMDGGTFSDGDSNQDWRATYPF